MLMAHNGHQHFSDIIFFTPPYNDNGEIMILTFFLPLESLALSTHSTPSSGPYIVFDTVSVHTSPAKAGLANIILQNFPRTNLQTHPLVLPSN